MSEASKQGDSDIRKSTQRWQSDVIVDLIKQYEFPYIALNPGASYRGLHDSLVNYGENQPPMLLCNHEKIAVQIAHGYAKASGKPMMAIVHNVVGLLHAPMGIYYAYIDRSPVFIVGATGPMDEKLRRPFIDWIHTAFAQGDVVRGFTKWDYQPGSIHGVPDSFARAYSIMMSEPQGPVYMVYDSAMQESPMKEEMALPKYSVKVPSRIAPEPAVDRRSRRHAHGRGESAVADGIRRAHADRLQFDGRIGRDRRRVGVRHQQAPRLSQSPSAERELSRRRLQRCRRRRRPRRCRLDARLAQAQYADARNQRRHRARLQMDRRRLRRYRDQQVGHRLQQAPQLGSPRARRQRAVAAGVDRRLPQTHRRQ